MASSNTSAASGEHPDWKEYQEAMRIQDKSLIRITPTRWVRSRLVDSRPTQPPDSTADWSGLCKPVARSLGI
jgi:hypothetical protein